MSGHGNGSSSDLKPEITLLDAIEQAKESPVQGLVADVSAKGSLPVVDLSPEDHADTVVSEVKKPSVVGVQVKVVAKAPRLVDRLIEKSADSKTKTVDNPTTGDALNLNLQAVELDPTSRTIALVVANTSGNQDVPEYTKKTLLAELAANKKNKVDAKSDAKPLSKGEVKPEVRPDGRSGPRADKEGKEVLHLSSGDWLSGQVYPSKSGLVSFLGNKATFKKGKEVVSFEVGKSLPNGETVRKVDSVNMSIVTDRRIITVIDDGS
jgi:hypothetical protein